jgi:hypothetical protein
MYSRLGMYIVQPLIVILYNYIYIWHLYIFEYKYDYIYCMYSYLRGKCLLSENGALEALFMGLFTMMDRWSVCISCINITYTHTQTDISQD